jgi:hypothetical protein
VSLYRTAPCLIIDLPMKDPMKLEFIIYLMSEDINIYAYLVQETWFEGTSVQKLKHGLIFIHHRPDINASIGARESRYENGSMAPDACLGPFGNYHINP